MYEVIIENKCDDFNNALNAIRYCPPILTNIERKTKEFRHDYYLQLLEKLQKSGDDLLAGRNIENLTKRFPGLICLVKKIKIRFKRMYCYPGQKNTLSTFCFVLHAKKWLFFSKYRRFQGA